MKPDSITEGELPHASTSIAHHRDFDNGQSHPNGTADSRSRTASDARGPQTSDQASGRPAGPLPTVWAQRAPIGRNDAPGDRDGLRAGSGSTSALSLSRMSAPLVSGQQLVCRTQGRNDQSALTRSSPAGWLFLALSGSQSALEETERRSNQCGRDSFADQ